MEQQPQWRGSPGPSCRGPSRRRAGPRAAASGRRCPSSWYGNGWNGTSTDLAAEQVVERRLQQVEQPVLEQDGVGRRLRADCGGLPAADWSGSGGTGTSPSTAGRTGFGSAGPAAGAAGRWAGPGTSSPPCWTAHLQRADAADPRGVVEQPGLPHVRDERRLEPRQAGDAERGSRLRAGGRRPRRSSEPERRSVSESGRRCIVSAVDSGRQAARLVTPILRASPIASRMRANGSARSSAASTGRASPAPAPRRPPTRSRASTARDDRGWLNVHRATPGRSVSCPSGRPRSPARPPATAAASTVGESVTIRWTAGRGLLDERLADQVGTQVLGQRAGRRGFAGPCSAERRC